MLWSARCAVCGGEGEVLCRRCWGELAQPSSAPPPAGLDRCSAAFVYRGAGTALVAALKFRNNRAVLDWAADAVLAAHGSGRGVDVVTWAPTSRRRRRARGYDQAELLARAVARRSRLRSRPLLRRLSEQPQTGRGRRDRLAGPRFVAAAVPGATVLVVDDVWTTGATLSAAGTALRNAGAARVLGATLARAGSAVEPSGGLP